MLGITGILIALILLTILLAAVFLVRPSVTVGATGKILAFVGLCVLPALCIGTGMSFHMQRSQQTAYCISCHSMETHGQSLYVLNANYIPAQHFQNHLVPSDKACYTCHTDYTMYGPLKDKLKGLKYLYMEYVSTPPKTIHLIGTYSNSQCLHCHAGTRDFEANPNHTAPMGSTNQISCISCHNTIHSASEVAHLQMWTEGVRSTSVTAGAAPATVELAATAGLSKAPGGLAGDATAAQGKSIYDSQGCGGCHGESGGGGTGPALTHTSSQYPPAQLTAVLRAPTAKMTAAGMAPLTVNAADMKALVSYVSSLGGTSAASAATPPAAGSFPSKPAKAQRGVTPEPPKAASAAAPPAAGSSSAAPATAEPAATAGLSKAPGGLAGDATAAQGKSIYDSQGCGGCHGESGGGGTGPALTHTSSQYPPAQLTAVLRAPTAKMTAAGMAPLTVNAADMKALVSYVSSLGGTSADSAATPLAAGSSSAATAALSKPGSKGTVILLNLNAADMEALVSYVSSLGGTSAAPAATLPVAGSAPPASAKAEPAATAAPSKPESKGRVILGWISLFLPYPHGTLPTAEPAVPAGPLKTPAGSSAGDATAAQGKSIYGSQGCGGCHGESGGGGTGPALTHTSSQYPPAQLTAVLRAPTAKMTAAGMVPLTVNAADMKALVSYVSSLGGTSAASAATPPAAVPSSAATAAPSNPESRVKSILRYLFVP